ncbi:hypothetical protein PENARI_c018G11840 [Penicillium arizonense]|uniref:Methyltransferase type 11 domain-containing protein n=1 Tax=Penicillium arizonense TaxID=1835702 RepID=A0A1F5LAI9_PENAI|nr:hypothetical protein PENARI_c018G11840 [Penicillium arizonense]OGE50097.1 hypothetical protein PENARI_c018G11840 [Penicillium arizonense]
MSYSSGHHMPRDGLSSTSPANAYGVRPPGSQVARPVNFTPRSRTSSFSSVEETSQVPGPSNTKNTNRGNRLSMLPRPRTGSTVSPTTPESAAFTQKSTQPIPSSLSSPGINNPSVFVTGQQVSSQKRSRNVLRRRAPTIGRHVEQLQSHKLSLVIPQEPQPVNMNSATKHGTPESLRLGHSASSYRTSHTNESSANLSSANSRFNGPEELASLRTTVDTQNLPPPPAPFFSASSPSTRYSESPSIWSRGSTPTSLSSYSPGIVYSTKVGRLRQPSQSQTRLPVFSPSIIQSSPKQERPEQKTQKRVPSKPSGSSSVGTDDQKQSTSKSPSTNIRGSPYNFSQRKSSVDSSQSKTGEIDTERARREVEEAERCLFDPQGGMECSPAGIAENPRTPPRPSRDGTHRLELETSPVVRSNLRYIRSTGHTRRESAEKVLAANLPHPTPNQSAAASIDSLHSRSISRISSRDGGAPVLSRKSPRTLTKEPPKEKPESKMPVPKRFGLFTKKSKPDMDVTTTEQARLPRKGPAAGTGHEGYGKYGQRGRKASGSSSSGTRTRSTSTTRSAASKGSLSSRPDLEIDDFLMSRLEPVIINGGGVDGASLSRTQSEQSMSSLSVASTSNLPRQSALTHSSGQSTDSLATSTGTFGDTVTPVESTGTASRNPSAERQTNISRPSASKSRMPVPKSNWHGVFANPQAAVTTTTLTSQESSIKAPRQPKKPAQQPSERPQKPEPAEQQQAKKGKTSMWNFFQKKNASEHKSEPPISTASHTAQLHAAISPVLNTRPVAHYAFVDADSDSLDEIINKIDDSPPTEEEEIFHPVEVPAGLNIRKREPSILLPSPPKLHGEFDNDRPSPKTAMFNRNLMPPKLESSPEVERPRRLASVGRIPQVVSRRDRQHRPVMQSFSRPFSVVESPSLTVPTTGAPHESPLITDAPLDLGIGPSEPRWGHGLNPAFSASEEASALDFLAGPFSDYEFLKFPPKKGSTSSDSSAALAAVTAVAPVPGSPPTEDEVWNEFDDLIDHVLSPEGPEPKEPVKSEEDDRFELATIASRALQDGLNNPNPTQRVPGEDSVRSSASSVRLRRSRIVSALHSSTAPSSQPSYSDLVSRYGDLTEDKINEKKDEDISAPTEQRSSTHQRREQESTFLQSLAAVPSPRPKIHRQQEAGSSEREWDAVTRTNMRSASLMTSRWLSFGRVLFSPAHNHVKTGGQGRILVVDGLGNDDWSFYCSLTYPDAEVYSLGGRPVSTAAPHPAAWQPPTNHHTVYHAGLSNPLPFPKDYFTVAVLRFPAVSSETVQGNIIQECKRVLRTGGYLEMSLLDRDMVNMGPRTRKAVRQLKETTCLSDSTISLKPASDSVQRQLGTQGFDNLRRCMVRIPVAGMVVRSSASTTSSSQSISATTPSDAFSLPTISVTTATGSQSTRNASKSPSDNADISLGDLLSDPSPSPANDESIAKIVARVGRWWYSKCYEDPVFPGGDSDTSMWSDRKVLRECQRRGTGFRMLIAYAQKPSEVPRRTASV